MKTGYSFGSLVSFTEALNAAAVKITGDQTIAGVKTFSSNPISSAAQGTGGSHLTRKDYVDGALALKAPLASPALTGTPTAPTAAAGTSTTQLATTAFVTASNKAQIGTATPLMSGTADVGVSTLLAREDHKHPTDTSRAPLASPALSGTPTAPTAAVGTNTTQLATTAFVTTAIVALRSDAAPLMNGTAAIGTSTQLTREDHVHPIDTSRAPLASPALTGTPTAPTAAVGANTTQLATTAFVQRAIGCYASYANASATASTIDISYISRLTNTAAASITYTIPLETSLVGVTSGSSFAIRTNSGYGATLAAAAGVKLYDESGISVTTYEIPINTSIEVTRLSVANAWVISSFSGVATTPATGDNSTRVATTAFVAATKTAMLATVAPLMDGTAEVGVSTLLAREDHKHPTDTSRAPLASPALTGTPTAPTQAVGTNNTTIATTAFVRAVAATVPLHGKQLFNSSGSFVVPTGVTSVWITGSGGGGGGGAGSSGSTGGGGGGGGGGGAAIMANSRTATSGSTLTITIGAGGAGATVGNAAALAGGATSIAGLPQGTIKLGGGGAGVSALRGVGGAAAGGAAGGAGGAAGAAGAASGGESSFGGDGGGSIFGPNGSGGAYSGSAGAGYGGGGGGGSNAAAGGAGASGFVMIEW